MAPALQPQRQRQEDPLEPLREMAGRSGKGVEEFAEKLDTWYDKSQKDEKARHEATIQVFTDFKNIAESNVRDLNNQNPSAGQGQLSHHKKQEIQRAAHLGVFKAGSSIFGQSLGQSFGQSSRTALSASSAKELREWQAELATWELVNAVFDLHHPAPGTDPEAMKREGLSRLGNDDDCTKNEVWERFIISDDLAREKKVVIKWLQQTAKNSENNVDLILEQWAKESGKDINKWKSGWLETKQTIKQAKRAQGVEGPLDPSVTIHGRDAEKPLVTRLDPDAQTRQKGALEKRDVYYEHALWMVAYEMLRRGESMNTINEWFKDRNEGYRAFMLGASGSSRSEGSPNMATPDFGYMHRRSCFLAAKSTSYPYEGAALGIVSGNYEPIQAISSSWDDHLYSYYNALLIARFDSFLLSTPKDRPRAQTHKAFNFPGITEHINNDWPNATKRVVELLKQNKSTSEQAKTPIKLIQSALLTRTLDELVHKVGVAMADFVRSNTSRPTFIVDPDHSEEEARAAGPDGLFSCKGQRSVVVEDYYQAFLHDPHALRILVHLFIVLGDPQDPLSSSRRSMLYARGNVVAAYVEYLQFAQRLQLIPLYASQMETERASMTLARVLPHIPERAEQELCVTNMRIYNIDVEDTLVRYFEFAMGQTGLVTGLNYEVKEPISRYLGMLEKPNADDPYEHLWPKCGRVKLRDNVTIAPEDKAVTHCLMWFDILEERDEDQFFARLVRAYATFLAAGHVHAAAYIREKFQDEHELPQFVVIMAAFQHWRTLEMQFVNQIGRSNQLKQILDMLKEEIFDKLFEPSFDPVESEWWGIYKAYMPEFILAYMSTLQSASIMLKADYFTTAMDLMTALATKDWLNKTFQQTCRLQELMDNVGEISAKSLLLDQKAGKTGKQGRTAAIWDPLRV